jgi:Domain of unknown function DUF11
MTARKLALAAPVALVALAAAVGAAHAGAAAPKPADVTVKGHVSSAEAYVGRSVVYSVVVSNVGGSDATSIGVDATIGGDAGAVAVEVTQALGSCSIVQPTHVTCSIDVLPRHETAKIRVQVSPALPGNIEFSSTTSAPGDADTTNDSSTATTAVHPGQPGPPEVRMGRSPKGAAPDPKGRTATVTGKIDVSEPGKLTVQVVDRALATNLPLLVGTTIGPTRLGVRQTAPIAAVGDAKTTGSTVVLYEVRLPLARLRPKRVYALVVQVVDLEGQEGNTLQIPFRLTQPTVKKKT